MRALFKQLMRLAFVCDAFTWNQKCEPHFQISQIRKVRPQKRYIIRKPWMPVELFVPRQLLDVKAYQLNEWKRWPAIWVRVSILCGPWISVEDLTAIHSFNVCGIHPLGTVNVWTTFHGSVCSMVFNAFRFEQQQWTNNPPDETQNPSGARVA